MRLNYKDCGKIGFTCSTFDLLHAGHITMLEEAKHHCVAGVLAGAFLGSPQLDHAAPASLLFSSQDHGLGAASHLHLVLGKNDLHLFRWPNALGS